MDHEHENGLCNPLSRPRRESLEYRANVVAMRLEDGDDNLATDERLKLGLDFLATGGAIKPGARIVIAALLRVVDEMHFKQQEE